MPLSQFTGDLDGDEAATFPLRRRCSPVIRRPVRFVPVKQRLIEVPIARPPVEAFRERILSRLARHNVLPFYLSLLRTA